MLIKKNQIPTLGELTRKTFLEKTISFLKENTLEGGLIWLITTQVAPDRLEEIYLDGQTGSLIKTDSMEYINN